MKFFIDTANVEDIKKANDMGVICGVTTNPSLIAKEGKVFEEVIAEIASIVDGPISGEVKATTTDAEGMIAEGRKDMIHPSYSELIEAINTNNEDDDEALVLNSRYSLVLAASKRARQLIAGAEPLVPGAAGKKPLSVAIDELYKGKVKILPGQEEEEELEALEAEKEALEAAEGETAEGTETAEAAQTEAE